MWQRFGVLRVKRQKASLNRQSSAYTCRGELSSHPIPIKWYGNRRSTQHSGWVIRPTQRAARNIIFHRWTAVRNILEHYFGSLEDDQWPGSIPGNTETTKRSWFRRWYSISCLALLDPIRRNWLRISRLVTIIAIGLRNPYAKSETGAGLILVWCLLTARCLMFTGTSVV